MSGWPTTERPTALVTGASGGLGFAFGALLASSGYDLVLVARTGEPMEGLARRVREDDRVEATVITTDLARPGAGGELADELDRRGLQVDVLVNNAGFTQLGPFAESDETVMLSLLRVNIEALTQLTRRLLPGMLSRGRGRVVNLASNAAFQPGPLMACYYASKAYVLSFSIALHEEVRDSGVTVTALCPGPTATGFQSRAGMENTRLVHDRRLPGADEVASWGWAQAERGRPFAVHSLRWKVFAFGSRFLPRAAVARAAMATNRRVDD